MLDTAVSDADIDLLLTELNRRIAPEPPLTLDQLRRAAIRGYADVQACPGSGKTTLVGLKLLCLARKWTETSRGICVLTHTNVARDEILTRVRQHSAGHRLLAYPHFIGTIQEFVNTFFALPACRSQGKSVARIDDAYCTGRLENTIGWTAAGYLANRKLSVSGMRYVWREGALVLNVPGFQRESDSKSYRDLLSAKTRLVDSGLYFYSEMYALARQLIASNPAIVETLRHRFPVVMIDEMQDAQKFQDDLINLVFEDGQCLLQRLGDPDQSIFDGLGGDEPNESYNGAALQPICESHRFTPSVARHVAGLSQRKLAITTTYNAIAGGPQNSIILYRDGNRNDVLNRFSEIVVRLDQGLRRVVKAVGGVAENDAAAADPLNLRSYWAAFDRARNIRSFVPASFCQAVRYCACLEHGDVSLRYGALLHAILDALRLAEKQTPDRRGRLGPISRTNLSGFLRLHDTEHDFRRLIAGLMVNSMPNAQEWPNLIARLKGVLTIDQETQSIRTFFAFDDTPLPPQADAEDNGNTYRAPNGVAIHVSTIHAVKGETHDATLVLETKYRKLFDVKEMLPFVLDNARTAPVFDAAHPTTNESIRAGFMKKLYVAASRPRHLLCIATSHDRITEQQRADLLQQQWQIVDL
jgi:DNA helicase-2/ATP-dependent DNA helicase PcrA